MAGIKGTFKIINKSVDKIEKIKAVVKKSDLPEETINILIYGLTLIIWLPKLLLEQKITLFRLKELLFGKSQKKEAKKCQNRDEDKKGKNNESDTSNSSSPPPTDEDKTSPPENNKKTDKQKSGRIAEHQYQNAIEHNISFHALAVGMNCPNACGGKLYNFRPAVRVIIKGNQMGIAHRYTIEKLRCALCNEVFTPKLPDELKGEKYDANFIAQLALQKYFIGVPCLRQQTYQKILDFPLPH